MSVRSMTFVWALICLLAGNVVAAQQQTTVWLRLDEAKIGPIVSCDGELSVSGGGQVTLQPWCQDGKDAVDGAKFKLTTTHSPQTAKAAKLPRVYRSDLERGIIAQVTAAAGAVLSGSTKLGDFEIGLEELRTRRQVGVLDGKIRLQWLPNVTRLTGNRGEEEYPSIAVLPDGRTAVAYVDWDGKADTVVLQIGDETRTITEKPGDYIEPRCAVDGAGKLWVVWTAGDGGRWDLWAHSDGKTFKLTTNPLNDFWPRLAADSHGNLWLAWQTVAENLHYELMLARLGPDGLSQPINVSQHPDDDWEPAICGTADGRIVVAWDTYRNGSYDVYLRQFTAAADGSIKPLGTARPVAASAKRESHPTLASDSKSRVWIAWDVSVEEWGKHPTGNATLHSDRSSDLACLADNRLLRVGADFMESLPEPYQRFIEYPQIAVDGRDRIWVIFRFENRVYPFYAAGKKGQSYGMWHALATQFDGRSWSEPVLLAGSNGRQDIRPGVALDPDGELLVVYGADGRTRRFPYRPEDYDVLTASLAGFGRPMKDFELVAADDLGSVTTIEPDAEQLPRPDKWSVGGKNYRLVLGDTHRHTDISRCGNGRDGSLQDAYRYALDTCGLDWLAISDHDQDILKHRSDRKQRPRQDYDWWRSQKYCDMYTIPGRFVAIYGYEHGGSYKARGGHKNIMVAQRGNPVEEVDAPDELFAALAGSGALAIPHQLSDGGSRMDWEKWDEEYERVAEIFQTRGSYEYEGCPRIASIYTQGNSMWDALAGGVRIGIIASSDHGQTHQARAGVYVEDVPVVIENISTSPGFTRQGILDGLRARRAFGSTIAVVMQVSIGEHALGQEITLSKAPTIKATVHAPADIVRLEVVRNSQFVYTKQPNKPQASFEFSDLDLGPGQSAYYYVRAQIGKDDYAWSSPIWVTRER